MNQNPKPDYFTLFNLPRRYALDETALGESWRALLSRVHPDTAALADAAVKRQSVEDAAYLNEAYRVLKDPVRRGEYLLQCYDEASTGSHETLPVEFLSEQLDMREAAEEAWQMGDRDRLESLHASLTAAQQQQQKVLAALFVDEAPSMEMLASARQHVLMLQFITRFADDLDEKLNA
ncbi:MAG: Fe-S protein assembly co-chaperone HscB [Burkholderiales bacterium]|jgi:molecular chaperone HscB|nr:Fe-S protein assembly co-chaperone HscB [Burkholderiales bacterium]